MYGTIHGDAVKFKLKGPIITSGSSKKNSCIRYEKLLLTKKN